jgi:hypothetical protein
VVQRVPLRRGVCVIGRCGRSGGRRGWSSWRRSLQRYMGQSSVARWASAVSMATTVPAGNWGVRHDSELGADEGLRHPMSRWARSAP